ncbi:helix-turn-helix domain-containing protein [Methylococcus geothermalis]|uniref:Helix-turn-helix domain-containing protein n=1 Tax=Methylococcus geothermalis TaxID=2681310 RepID=A0A858Q5K5_9GAMM|nr:helix-turn-helix domain-containing protein [Methylococcus geothermalis]QJD29063.1 helix-turn-helix domain-containing protein [Methylococcus geothermalis]
MTDLDAPFAPDWVSPPGDTIADVLEERGWTQAELARRLGYTEKHVSQLINGKAPVTEETASRLERVIGSTAGFWLRREALYRERLERQKSAERCAGWTDWLDKLPLKELMEFEAIPKLRVVEKHKPALVEACLRFFGVASPEEWNVVYPGMQAHYRRSREEQSDLGAIATWLRLGEKQAEAWDSPKFDRARFERALREIRSLTVEPPQVFEPGMKRLLREAGVVLVLVPAIPRAHVSGVARWLTPSRPLIQLSLYGKTNDRFWFTFFHEAAHLLLHGTSAEDRKAVFLDDPDGPASDDAREHEANQWAADFLIPREHIEVLQGLTRKADVRAFAQALSIHPGIVVGRLQHERIIPPSWMNGLKVSFRWSHPEPDVKKASHGRD